MERFPVGVQSEFNHAKHANAIGESTAADPPASASSGRDSERNLVSERGRLGGKVEQIKGPPLLREHKDAPDAVDKSECIQRWRDQHLLNDAQQPPEFDPASDAS
jgi:hypothetical protein